MKPYKVRWTDAAVLDLRTIHDFIAAENPLLAARIAGLIVKKADTLDTFPGRGRSGRDDISRELVLSGWPWIIVYDIGEGEVQILRVLHSAQDCKSEDAAP